MTALHVLAPVAPVKTRKKVKSKRKVAEPMNAPRKAITVAMGAGIPLFSLGLSTVAGTLARSGYGVLSGSALLLTAAVLAVSLSHLAWAVRDITRSALWASWSLAVAFDLALVLGEMVHVYAVEAGLGTLVTVIMAAVCGVSMVLNVWAFLCGPTHK